MSRHQGELGEFDADEVSGEHRLRVRSDVADGGPGRFLFEYQREPELADREARLSMAEHADRWVFQGREDREFREVRQCLDEGILVQGVTPWRRVEYSDAQELHAAVG